MEPTHIDRAHFTVIENFDTRQICIGIRSLNEMNSDNVAALKCRLMMTKSVPDVEIKLCIPRAIEPGTSDEDDIGSLAFICARFTNREVLLRQMDVGTETKIRAIPIPT